MKLIMSAKWSSFCLGLKEWRETAHQQALYKIEVCANYVLMCYLKHNTYTLHPLLN